MASTNSGSNPGNWIISTVSFLILGIALGFVLSQAMGAEPVQTQVAAIGVGFVWAAILLQLVDLVGQALALLSSPLADDFKPGVRDDVRKTAEQMKASPAVLARIKNLLMAWSEGLSPVQVIQLAQFQSQRSKAPAAASMAFGALVLLAAGLSLESPVLVWSAAVALGLVFMARTALSTRADAYIEAKFLCKLPGNLPNTGMTVDELSSSIGKAIESTFQEHMPKPEQYSSALQSAMQEAGKTSAEQLTSARNALQSGLSGVGKEAVDQLTAALSSQSDRLESTSESLTAQIEKLTEVEKRIDSLIDAQKAAGDTLQSVTTTEEFKNTLGSLQKHLELSDSVLKELTKPRTITLVEEDGDVAAG